jgi:ABC-type transporter Mla subunit MlaD
MLLKWLYFVLVAVFLAALLWMVNDMRVRVGTLVDRLDRQLPPILDNTEQAAKRVNDQLPQLLQNSEKAVRDLDTHLPKLLAKAQQGVEQLAALAKSFRDFKDLFPVLAAASGDKRQRP